MSVVESPAASTIDVSRRNAPARRGRILDDERFPRSSIANQIESAPTFGVECALQSTTTIRSNDTARAIGTRCWCAQTSTFVTAAKWSTAATTVSRCQTS